VSTVAIEGLEKIPTQNYTTSEKPLPVYRIIIHPEATPVDINVQFIMEEGWNQTDRLRFHTAMENPAEEKHPLLEMIEQIQPHLLLRRYNIEED